MPKSSYANWNDGSSSARLGTYGKTIEKYAALTSPIAYDTVCERISHNLSGNSSSIAISCVQESVKLEMPSFEFFKGSLQYDSYAVFFAGRSVKIRSEFQTRSYDIYHRQRIFQIKRKYFAAKHVREPR